MKLLNQILNWLVAASCAVLVLYRFAHENNSIANRVLDIGIITVAAAILVYNLLIVRENWLLHFAGVLLALAIMAVGSLYAIWVFLSSLPALPMPPVV